MSHQAIIKRDVIEVEPQWFEYVNVKLDNPQKVIVMQDIDGYLNSYNLKNAVIDVISSTTVDFIWEGVINQEVLKVGDKLNLDFDIVKIIDVEKHVNGSVVYEVESVTINCDNYDELLKTCKEVYEYSKNKVTDEDTHTSDTVDENKNKKSWLTDIFK